MVNTFHCGHFWVPCETHLNSRYISSWIFLWNYHRWNLGSVYMRLISAWCRPGRNWKSCLRLLWMCSELHFSSLSLLTPTSACAFPGPHWALLMENYFFFIVFQKKWQKERKMHRKHFSRLNRLLWSPTV